jgi:hypothetical protein
MPEELHQVVFQAYERVSNLMRLSTGNKRQANHNGRMESLRLKRKRSRSTESEQKGTPQALLQDSERDTNINRRSGNVIREQGKETFVATESEA